MASLCDSNCITLNYSWNDPFLGWGYKSGSLKLLCLLAFHLCLKLSLYDLHMKKQLSPILAPLSKTNIDSDESANYDGRLFPQACMKLGACTRLKNVFDSGRCMQFKGGSRLWEGGHECQIPAGLQQRLPGWTITAGSFPPGESSYPAPLKHRRLKNEWAGDRTGSFNERPMPGMCTQVYLVKLSDLFF